MKKFGRIVVVGASLAGLRGIEALRREGHEGRILAIGDEPCRPYDRPPLTKQFLKGEWDDEKIVLRDSLGDDPQVEWLLGRRVAALDPVAKEVRLEDGEAIGYDGLMIASGAHAQAFPNAPDLAGIFTLRSISDAEAIRRELEAGPRVVVIGAGFIGMEIAATCRERGLDVTVVEAIPTPLVRGLGPDLGRHVGGVFRDHGVDLRCGVGVAGFEGEDRVAAVRLKNGSRIPAELVIVGIGARPNTDWLEGSGLRVEDGVVCDETCATEAPDVVAAGDVARWRDARTGLSVRAEHWTNAVEQSAHAARCLLLGGAAGPYQPVPYVWTDQFELRIQIVGEVREGDEMAVRHGSLDEGRFVALFGRDGLLTGAVGFRRPRQLNEYHHRIGAGIGWQESLDQAE